jgi:RNA polymerase sigma factor for flagellar operon FliA
VPLLPAESAGRPSAGARQRARPERVAHSKRQAAAGSEQVEVLGAGPATWTLPKPQPSTAFAVRSAAPLERGNKRPRIRVQSAPLAGVQPTAADGEAERRKLWRAYRRSPNDETRNRLVEAYQPLVREIVSRFGARLPRSVDRGDLATAGNMGLIAAIQSFDGRRGVRFEAYGDRRIRGALLDELRTQDWLPRPWRRRLECHKQVAERLCAELGREPHDEELAAALGLSVAGYQSLFGLAWPLAPGGAVRPAEGDDDAWLEELEVVPDPRARAADEELTREELLALCAQRMSPQEHRIVYLKYWQELSLREIGALTGLSESRICKIHAQLLERLAERLAGHAADL